MFRAAYGVLGHFIWTRPWRLLPVVDRVNAAGEGLSGLDDTRLRGGADEVRRRSRKEGLTRELAVRAFALARESAHRTLGMRPYDVQLMGAWALLKGMVAEMETGEGKTLTATLAAAAAALA
ncbi:MAG: prepilin peptidase, partial [bacterium]